jgi:transcriptional regulator with XRE-family HTH domain
MTETKEIIYLARNRKGLSQKDFSRIINKSQAMISKYESGKAIPPGNILVLCQEMLNETDINSSTDSISIDIEELIQMLRSKAAGEKQTKLRQTIRQIIEITTNNP